MADRIAVLTALRTQLLDECEAAGWPEICGAGVGRIDGPVGWTAAIEAATGDELTILARLLYGAAA